MGRRVTAEDDDPRYTLPVRGCEDNKTVTAREQRAKSRREERLLRDTATGRKWATCVGLLKRLAVHVEHWPLV